MFISKKKRTINSPNEREEKKTAQIHQKSHKIKRFEKKQTERNEAAIQAVAFSVHMSTVFSYRPDKSGSRFVRNTHTRYTLHTSQTQANTHTLHIRRQARTHAYAHTHSNICAGKPKWKCFIKHMTILVCFFSSFPFHFFSFDGFCVRLLFSVVVAARNCISCTKCSERSAQN